MHRKSMLCLFVVLLVGMAALWGCPKKSEVTTTPAERVTAPSTPAATEPGTADGKTTSNSKGSNERAGATAQGLKPVYFDFDKSFIRDDAKAVMKANAEWLKANPKVKISIEGDCDERGTKEYNQALGQRRAASAKKYLIDLGVSGQRISLISYGKEKPVCNEHDEACWQKNRHDDFVVARN
jgi:peptidoglycan-associated lipoprotein